MSLTWDYDTFCRAVPGDREDLTLSRRETSSTTCHWRIRGDDVCSAGKAGLGKKELAFTLANWVSLSIFFPHFSMFFFPPHFLFVPIQTFTTGAIFF